MQAIILKLIDQLNSSVFLLFGILLVAFWALYKLGGVVKMFDIFQQKNKDLDTHVHSIKETLATIKATTDLLYQVHVATIKAHSPISLTDKGIKIASELKLSDKVGSHWEQIKNEISKRSPANPYDVQVVSMDMSRDCFEKFFSDEEKNVIKLYAYQTGQNLLEIYPIVGVLIRDAYLKEKGFTLAAVDQHNPKK